MKFNRTRWSILITLVFCATALAQAHLPGSRSNYKTNSFATVAAREPVNAQANLQLIELLESGKEVTGSVQASTVANDCVLGGKQYKIEIVGGDKKLRVVLGGDSNVDLYIRRGAPVAIEDGEIVSDFKSVSPRTSRGYQSSFVRGSATSRGQLLYSNNQLRDDCGKLSIDRGHYRPA